MKTHPSTRNRSSRPVALIVTAAIASQLCSCIQPPPPRTYNPKVAKHLRELSHDRPVTPIPSAYGYGYGYCGYYPYWGY